jgi:hypothetical protein
MNRQTKNNLIDFTILGVIFASIAWFAWGIFTLVKMVIGML